MSPTYISALVIVLVQVLPYLGIEVGGDELTTTINTVITVVAGLLIAWRRFVKGDITALGSKK